MHRTLVSIPHEIAGLPVFGVGWALLLLAVVLAIRLGIAHRHGESVGKLARTEGLMWGIIAAVIAWVLPAVELQNVAGEPVGMAIRGYGVMLLIGVSTAVALAAYRAKRRGLDPDVIYAVAPWAFIGGILGARIFFVVQYREKFIADSWRETVGNMLDFTSGGLVVYGSFIGGFIAVSFFLLRQRLPLLRWGDAIVPALFLGVFFGRIGCLMNGCCYGGRCEDYWAALHFPPGSAVYGEQIESGELLGMRVDSVPGKILEVREASLADRAGIRAGSTLEAVRYAPLAVESAPLDVPREDVLPAVVISVDGRLVRWDPDELPRRALAVQPAQLISSIGALSLCLALCAVPPYAGREGTIMFVGFAGYAVLRFVLELIRVDEAGQFGTSLSISQLVSVFVLVASIIGLAWIYRKPLDGAMASRRTANL